MGPDKHGKELLGDGWNSVKLKEGKGNGETLYTTLNTAETYWDLSPTSMMELFAYIVNGFKVPS